MLNQKAQISCSGLREDDVADFLDNHFNEWL